MDGGVTASIFSFITKENRMPNKLTTKLDELAIKAEITWTYAESLRFMPSSIANRQYFPLGILLLHMDSHRTWSLKDTESAITFLKLWLDGIEVKSIPNLTPAEDLNIHCGHITPKGKRLTGCGAKGITTGFFYLPKKRTSSIYLCPSCAALYEQFS
jgi:hypothetical protein